MLVFIIEHNFGDYLFESITSIGGKSKYYDASKEAAKEKLLKENNGAIEYMTNEERRIIYYEDYAEADDIPEFAYWLTIVLIVTGYSAIWCGSKESLTISFVLCIVLIFFSWKLIALALLTDIVFIPMGQAAIVSSLFKKD